MKIRPVGAELFHANRRTDRQTDRLREQTRLIVFFFRKFANASENTDFFQSHYLLHCRQLKNHFVAEYETSKVSLLKI